MSGSYFYNFSKNNNACHWILSLLGLTRFNSLFCCADVTSINTQWYIADSSHLQLNM